MTALKLRKIGNSVGAVFPQEALVALNVGEGDTLYLSRASDGYRLTPYNPEFERQMAAARKIMKKDRHILRELAKR
jgi:putative addiction module antidote